jgi:cyclic pyranopterin phosphate synthase
LFAVKGTDLRAMLRDGADDDDLDRVVSTIWRERTDRYSEVRSEATGGLDKVEMSYIGG